MFLEYAMNRGFRMLKKQMSVQAVASASNSHSKRKSHRLSERVTRKLRFPILILADGRNNHHCNRPISSFEIDGRVDFILPKSNREAKNFALAGWPTRSIRARCLSRIHDGSIHDSPLAKTRGGWGLSKRNAPGFADLRAMQDRI